MDEDDHVSHATVLTVDAMLRENELLEAAITQNLKRARLREATVYMERLQANLIALVRLRDVQQAHAAYFPRNVKFTLPTRPEERRSVASSAVLASLAADELMQLRPSPYAVPELREKVFSEDFPERAVQERKELAGESDEREPESRSRMIFRLPVRLTWSDDDTKRLLDTWRRVDGKDWRAVARAAMGPGSDIWKRYAREGDEFVLDDNMQRRLHSRYAYLKKSFGSLEAAADHFS